VLTAQYLLPGLDIVSRLASRAGVSAPTVIRLVDKLVRRISRLPAEAESRTGGLPVISAGHVCDAATGRADGVSDVLGRAIDTFGEGIGSSEDSGPGIVGHNITLRR
jgi:hypothetical protein